MDHMLRVALTLSLLGLALPAAAQSGTLQVRVTDSAGRPTDGTVTLNGSGGRRSCRTVAGRCQLALPAGTWTATLVPVRDQAPPSSTVTVTPNRTAVLTLRTRPTTVVTGTVTGTQATAATRCTPNTPVVTTQTHTGTVTTRTNGTTTNPRTNPTTTRRTVTVQGTNGTQTGPRVVRTNPAVQQRTPPPPTTMTTTTTTYQGNTRAVTTRATSTASLRNLGQGNRVCVNGQVTDATGRPTDATLTVAQNGRVLGTVRSVAGRFTMYDLPPGQYQVTIAPARGGAALQTVRSIGNAVARWTVRTP